NAYAELLKDVGFSEVINLPPGETTIQALEPVNLWQRQGESLYVEAYKPSQPSNPFKPSGGLGYRHSFPLNCLPRYHNDSPETVCVG
ncbi:MAG: hypothetical protein ACKOYH_09690, partial [Cyanobium sp.]